MRAARPRSSPARTGHERLQRVAREREAQRIAHRGAHVGNGLAGRGRPQHDGVVGRVDDGQARPDEQRDPLHYAVERRAGSASAGSRGAARSAKPRVRRSASPSSSPGSRSRGPSRSRARSGPGRRRSAGLGLVEAWARSMLFAARAGRAAGGRAACSRRSARRARRRTARLASNRPRATRSRAPACLCSGTSEKLGEGSIAAVSRAPAARRPRSRPASPDESHAGVEPLLRLRLGFPHRQYAPAPNESRNQARRAPRRGGT